MFSYLLLVIMLLSINLYDCGLFCPYKQLDGETKKTCGASSCVPRDGYGDSDPCQCNVAKCGK